MKNPNKLDFNDHSLNKADVFIPIIIIIMITEPTGLGYEEAKFNYLNMIIANFLVFIIMISQIYV